MAITANSAPDHTVRGVLLSTLAGGLAASVVNIVIGVAARAAGADPHQSGMAVGSEVFLSIIGVLVGAIGWAIVRRLAKRPAQVLSILVPIVFVLSLAPDLGVGITTGAGPTWTAVIGLMIMHLMTVAIAIPVYRRFLPLPR